MDEGTEVDLFAFKLTELQSRIASIDPSQRLSNIAKKNRLLNYFDSCCDGRYSGSVTVLKLDKSLTFSDAVNSLRSTQENSKRHFLPIEPVVALTNGPNLKLRTTVCAHCHRKGHTREFCFIWLDTPDGTKWAAKNPAKAYESAKRRAN
ncbi:Bgt-20801 [Blumeria graminis f. sp. tritici]|uniref:Bgt-20801 n=2 Tax=Blumeria graminis f. sp. tritici TaxID=62690 RepID=A0A9X9MM68_BLUGR|nr:Bgt-20801 [Blumeria graminis f. sp. tritici]